MFQPKEGLSRIYGSIQDGIFHCKFTRSKVVLGDEALYNLNNDFHVMYAHGPAVNGIVIFVLMLSFIMCFKWDFFLVYYLPFCLAFTN